MSAITFILLVVLIGVIVYFKIKKMVEEDKNCH